MKTGRFLTIVPLLGLLAAGLGERAAADTSTQPFHVRIDFRPATSPAPIGFLADTGAAYGPRGNGFTYGWNADNTANMRDRGFGRLEYDTLARMQNGGAYSWGIDIPNATYTVKVVAGDADFIDSVYKINVENVLLVNGTPSAGQKWVENYARVTVSDGRLNITNAAGAVNNKICFLEISPFRARVNFQPASASVPFDYKADTGAVYGSRVAGYSYGWNADNTANMRIRGNDPQPYTTLARTQNGGSYTWQIGVPNGRYNVNVVAGDPDFIDSVYKVNVENVLAISATPTSTERWASGTLTVPVADGRLTVGNAPGAVNNKLCFVEIEAATLLDDGFNRTTLGPDWESFGWNVDGSGRLVSTLGGYGEALTRKTFVATDYVIESRITGLAPGSGPSPSDRIYLAFGSDGSGASEYRLSYYPTQFGSNGLFLSKRIRLSSGEIGEETLDAAPFRANGSAYYAFKIVLDGASGTLTVFVDQGQGYAPVLLATDTTYPMLGRFGWGIERESPGFVAVDAIKAQLLAKP